MRLQLLSDLHLETETFSPQPAPGADVLVLAGDIDAQHTGLDRFAEWPVPVLFVAGNHEFDNKDFDATLLALRERCER
ncbi:MAG: metallophosphoesterase, partial [Thiomonas delicata]